MTTIAPCLDGRHEQCEHVIEFSVAFERRTLTCDCKCHG